MLRSKTKIFLGRGTAASLDTLPPPYRPLPSGKRDTPSPHLIPIGAFGASIRPPGKVGQIQHCAPKTNSWPRLCYRRHNNNNRPNYNNNRLGNAEYKFMEGLRQKAAEAVK